MLIGTTCLLCLIGLIMVLAASTSASLLQYGSPWAIFERQAIYMGAGVIALWFGARLNVAFWRRMRLVMLFVTFGLLVAVLVPGIGHAAGGSSRWIGAGLIRIQPSELMKFTMVVFAAELVTRREKGLVTWRDQWHQLLRPLATILLLAVGMIISQPDMGTAVILVCIALAILYAGGVHIRLLSGAAGLAAVGAVIFSMSKPYQRQRLLSFIDPVQHLTSGGYQSVQGFAALQTGGVAGTGVGSPGPGWGYLPNAHTDFIFAIIGGQLGMLGALTVILLVGLFAWFGFRVAARTTDRFSSLLAFGITSWILCQAIINIGAVIGVLPVTGIPLPFVSYGGSALVVLMLATGILIGIGRRNVIEAFYPRVRRRRR
jgi:cell division protein FtsW